MAFCKISTPNLARIDSGFSDLANSGSVLPSLARSVLRASFPENEREGLDYFVIFFFIFFDNFSAFSHQNYR